MPQPSETSRPCSIKDTLDLLGARWTFLVLRELQFGVGRFDAIAAATGAPRNLVASRLRLLEDAGLVHREAYQERPTRYEYRLTPEGMQAAELLLVLMGFGDRRRPDDPPVVWHHGRGAGVHELQVAVTCAACGRPAHQDLHDPVGSGAPMPG